MDADCFLDENGEFDASKMNESTQEWYTQLAEINEEERTVSETAGIESMQPRVVNVVAVATYNSNFGLYEISTRIRNAEYNPKRMKAVTIRINDPSVTARVFGNGKINLMGCKTIDDCHKAAKKFCKLLRKIGYEQLKLIKFDISSIVAVANTQFNVQIDRLARTEPHTAFCTYNTDNFAGLIYRLVEPKVTMIIFQSGSIILNGAKTVDELTEATQHIHPILKNFEKKSIQ